MFLTLSYVIIYYNIDKLLQTLYIPYIIPNNNYEIISNCKELYFLVKMTSYFMLALYSYTLTYKLFILKREDINSIALSFIYIKYLLDILVSPNYTIIEYELNRIVMWTFTTPLMLKMYCDANDISVTDINIHYHIIAIVPHVFIIPFKNQLIYILSTILFSVPEIFFLRSLHKYKQKPFTNLYIFIWIIFILINLLDITQVCSQEIIHALYNITDTLCKFICNVVISNYIEQKIIGRENMDLQSVQFISYVVKSIKKFENNNIKLSPYCKDLMQYSKKKFINKIPKTNEKLKLELLTKILPFNLDRDYIDTGGDIDDSSNKTFNFICVMFMDIVNYTELANRYKSGDTIFRAVRILNTGF
jgi:hypothetical protein